MPMVSVLSQVSCNDAVLVLSLCYLSLDMQLEWEYFAGCRRPIHKWLLVSYGLIVASRVVYVGGTILATQDSGDFLLNLRPKETTMRVLMSLTWLVILPFFTIWTVLGTSWLSDIHHFTPHCLPNGVHLWFLAIWQLLSYFWIIIHCGLGIVAWFLERKVRKAEGDLRQIEDADVLARWGQVSRLHGYTSLTRMSTAGGLTPSQIGCLPCEILGNDSIEEECPICLNILHPGDAVRQLTSCSHTFHRSCIDLWLLRRADCPLCKRDVKTEEGQGWTV